MPEVTEQNAAENLDRICDEAVKKREPILITREQAENVVIVSQTEYDNLLENIYVRKSSANYTRLLESIEEAKAGKLTSLKPSEDYD